MNNNIVKNDHDNKKTTKGKIINTVVLFVLGVFCYLYSVYGSDFAELNIQLPFLNFPIFVGEILLIFCLLMLFIKLMISPIEFNRWHLLLYFYAVFILIKACFGYYYSKGGSLALRNSALFYYPFFAVIGYYFYNIDFFKKSKIILILPFLLLLTIRSIPFSSYAPFTYFMLGALLILSRFKPKKIKYLFLIIFLLFFPYRELLLSSRSALLASLTGIISSISLLLFSSIKLKLMHKKIFIGLTVTSLAIAIFIFGNRTDLASLVTWNQHIHNFKLYDAYIAKHINTHKFTDYSTKIYSKNKNSRFGKFSLSDTAIDDSHDFISTGNTVKEDRGITASEIKYSGEKTGLMPKAPLTELVSNNTLFRMFLWRDMFSDLFSQQSIFGVSFGRPFYSKSIEILNWARDWRLDGWLPLHNSYLHLIYRGGIVGVLVIAFLFWTVFRILRFCMVYKSFTAIILLGTIIYWLIIPCFLEILELPYSAILFWSLLGMTLRYCDLERKTYIDKK